MNFYRVAAAFTLASIVIVPAFATTRWQITDTSKFEAIRVSTEQAARKAGEDHSCYLPAVPRQCRLKAGMWTCTAENPTKASDCGRRGRWKHAVPAD